MCSSPLNGVCKHGSVGRAQGGVNVCIIDGEVAVRGTNVTPGYLRNDKANIESFVTIDGHRLFKTGDQGYIDTDGYVFLTGRLKELINRGGEKISPLEIDAVLVAHPAVSDAVAYGVADQVYGEVVHAAVILKLGASASADELRKFCGFKLAAFKCPSHITICRDFPRTATGKV